MTSSFRALHLLSSIHWAPFVSLGQGFYLVRLVFCNSADIANRYCPSFLNDEVDGGFFNLNNGELQKLSILQKTNDRNTNYT